VQPVQIVIERAIGSSFVIVDDFFGDGFAVAFMLLGGGVVLGGEAADPPDEEWDERGEDGEDGGGHGGLGK